MEYLALLLLIPIIPIYVYFRIKGYHMDRKRRQLRDFRVILDALSVSLRAGYSVERAIPEITKVLRKTLGNQNDMTLLWTTVEKKMELKISTDVLIQEFAASCDAEEIHSFAQVFVQAKRLGGNLSSIVAKTADTISRKIEVEEEIQTLLASKKMEQRVMSIMPLGIILYMRLTSPGYLDPLYHSLFGVCVMTACLVIWIMTLLWGQKLIQIEV